MGRQICCASHSRSLLHPPPPLKLLEAYNLPRLNQEEMENLNSPITSNGIEAVIQKFPTSQSSRLEGFTSEFYQNSKEN